jgi:hypothetical protein
MLIHFLYAISSLPRISGKKNMLVFLVAVVLGGDSPKKKKNQRPFLTTLTQNEDRCDNAHVRR